MASHAFLQINHRLQFILKLLKEIRLQKISLISEERGWREKHFATNFMKIGGSVS